MTHEDLDKVESQEFRDALVELLPVPAFQAIVAMWLAPQVLPEGPIDERSIPVLNWNFGRARLVAELYESIENVNPIHARKIDEKVKANAARRRDAS